MAGMKVTMNWRGDQVKQAVRAHGINGVAAGAEHLRGVSASMAPIDEGDLRRSADVELEEQHKRASVSFTRPYAAIQHEELTYSHPKGGHAKYLEIPLTSEERTIQEIVAAHIRRAIT